MEAVDDPVGELCGGDDDKGGVDGNEEIVDEGMWETICEWDVTVLMYNDVTG